MYMSIYKAFQRPWLLKYIAIEIHMLQQEFACTRQVKTIEGILHFKTNKKVELLQF